MSVRTSKRKSEPRKIPQETPSTSGKWNEDEIEKVLNCIMEHGHKNIGILKTCIPDKTGDKIKTFIRTALDTSIRLQEGHCNLDSWIQNCCKTSDSPPWKDSLQLAQVIKYLSIDGLIEKHPSPSHCQGINFSEAYRLLYQALMGYPIQPVNKETSDFVLNTLKELTCDIKKLSTPAKNVNEFLIAKTKQKSLNVNQKNSRSKISKLHPSSSSSTSPLKSPSQSTKRLLGNEPNSLVKPIKVYQRKKSKLSNETSQVPMLKIVVEENEKASIQSGFKGYSVSITEDNKTCPTIMNVPVPVGTESMLNLGQKERNLIKSSTYNPFEIPEKWLMEPLSINLLTKPMDLDK